ncbi:stage V sporulation protein AD [Mycoplasmatota bacterium]|nr:stage V sporulation protein AD [Mycoplasmatota bacterium]
MKKATVVFNDTVYLKGTGTSVGPLEKEGPLGEYFDRDYKDNYCGEKNWENAEERLLSDAITIAIVSSGLDNENIDLAIAGDLINQNVISNYVMRDFDIPFLGMYGACSTSMQTLLTASLLINSKEFTNIVAAACSHNSTAERQFRYPTEYGGQKPKSMTYTVTGAGAAIVTNKKSSIKISSVTIGRVIDANQNDPNDMGCAMAPAASDTIIRHLKELNISPDYYDMIVTGDLSKVGSRVLLDIMREEGYNIDKLHEDCGKLIFTDKQPVFSGGSGCACCAVVTYGYIKNLLEINKIKRVLVVATGALLNPVMMLQKETIPSIAHAVAFEKCDEVEK